ncbi:hypothetical protein NEFER03_1173 [Nematocida sp. LUAm3]|nr:hypothetical protein NEFER03_1173 [Nematocida sp. LUAm3]KAI5175782.1 hypothetical protein NEFER02_1651 [Nematocida sp. LUAm2]KAI5178278.1 hypothetical protein NEFER01_1445 [Nematocida sp. LUAm1]
MGARFLKLKHAYEKMIEQIEEEIEIANPEVKEDLLSSIQQILLKYSIPSKLDELDSRVQQPSVIYDISAEESITQIMKSYLHKDLSIFLAGLEKEQKAHEKEIEERKEEEQECSRRIDEAISSISSLLEKSSSSISEIRKYIR